ncbi:hypothetical protein P7K49_017400 [Saguinus oedipus]|uniref:Golgin subfamily A conserved domain-containing protein n=1 Tax=Saguinus oedipus TaxID=9490 RepID=A0ABQ9V2E7_SAGOE|nr:hypothetical protein P7K49_017400 [Saguinus oedipus]
MRLRQQEVRLKEQKERLLEWEVLQEQEEELRWVNLGSSQVPFLNTAGAGAQEEQACLCEQLQKQQVCCQHQGHPVASALKEPEAAATATGTGSKSGCGETQRALQGAINKLHRDFMDIVKENADLKEWRDMIGKYIKPNDRQRAVAKTQHQKNDVSMLSQAEEGMKAKLLELQGPVMQLVINHNVQHPANEPTSGAPAPQEFGAADKVSLDNDSDSLEPAGGRIHHNPTAQQMAHGFVSCGMASNTDPLAAAPLCHAFTKLWEKEWVNISIS